MRVALFLGLVAVASAAIMQSPNGELIKGEYIVIFEEATSMAEQDAHIERLVMSGGKVKSRYSGPLFGYAIAHEEATMVSVSEEPIVKYVEQNQVARALCDSSPVRETGLWGLGRVSAADMPTIPGDRIVSSNHGRGIDVYIIDTGLLISHEDFGGRASYFYNCAEPQDPDGNGHGTHCGGTAAGTNYGLATESTIYGVKVLNSFGSGTFDCVIDGINRVGAEQGLRVGSLSLGGGFSQAVNDAVNSAVRAGAAMVSASGNSNANACNFSPASAEEGVCVNSMDNRDARSSFSNFGPCSDIFAPGTNVMSAWIGSNTATNTISGTSMAAPHVTGVLAETWSSNPELSASQIQDMVIRNGVEDKITNAGTGSPNVLAQTSCA